MHDIDLVQLESVFMKNFHGHSSSRTSDWLSALVWNLSLLVQLGLWLATFTSLL